MKNTLPKRLTPYLNFSNDDGGGYRLVKSEVSVKPLISSLITSKRDGASRVAALRIEVGIFSKKIVERETDE